MMTPGLLGSMVFPPIYPLDQDSVRSCRGLADVTQEMLDRQSRALSKGEDALLVKTALTDSVGEGDVGERPTTETSSDLLRPEIEPGRHAFGTVIAVMGPKEVSDRGVVQHDEQPPNGDPPHFSVDVARSAQPTAPI